MQHSVAQHATSISISSFLENLTLPQATLLSTIGISCVQGLFILVQFRFNYNLQKQSASIAKEEFETKRRLQIQSLYRVVNQVDDKLSKIKDYGDELNSALKELQNACVDVALAAGSKELFDLSNTWANEFRSFKSKSQNSMCAEASNHFSASMSAEDRFRNLVGAEVGLVMQPKETLCKRSTKKLSKLWHATRNLVAGNKNFFRRKSQ